MLLKPKNVELRKYSDRKSGKSVEKMKEFFEENTIKPVIRSPQAFAYNRGGGGKYLASCFITLIFQPAGLNLLLCKILKQVSLLSIINYFVMLNLFQHLTGLALDLFSGKIPKQVRDDISIYFSLVTSIPCSLIESEVF